ncbi:MAG: class I SAM-dependent methyltransferase [Candidatus Sulfotelmatobacter sp.]
MKMIPLRDSVGPASSGRLLTLADTMLTTLDGQKPADTQSHECQLPYEREMMPRVSVTKQTLSSSAVHKIWEQTYRTPQSERFYEVVFKWIAAHEQLHGMKALDIGCGVGQHAIRLAKNGCSVVAADFSADRAAAAEENIERQGFDSRITTCNQDLEAGLSFAEGTYDIVLCWGVLMHIPQIVPAIRELIRVTRPGGRILVYEANLFGMDAATTIVSTAVKRAVGRASVRRVQFSEFGIEYWIETPTGELLIRHSRLGALARIFEVQGCQLRYRIAGEFTEKYSLGGALGGLAHLWNRFWFAGGHIPYLAHGNLLIFERSRPDSAGPQK